MKSPLLRTTPGAALLTAALLLPSFIVVAQAHAGVAPMVQTRWGQGGPYQTKTPHKDGAPTYAGCTTIASAQILNYYRYQDHANASVSYSLEHAPLSGPDVIDGAVLDLDLSSVTYDWNAFAPDLDSASAAQIDATATFIYHVGVTLTAQFGGGEGSSATGKQIENAFRYQWGYNAKSRRSMSVISKDAFGYSDAEWAAVIRAELDAGRPVMYMAQQLDADAGHAFVIDGYDDAGRVHVNWGWGGYGNGYFDVNTLKDPSGRQWIRQPMIFRGLEPEDGFAAAMAGPPSADLGFAWNGAASLISYASDLLTGYGLTLDEAQVHPGERGAVVFLQWEVDTRDGRRLRIDAPGLAKATITYGEWNRRSADRTYRDVSLPFVLDPTRDGFAVSDQSYFTLAIAFDDAPSASVTVEVAPTNATASSATSVVGAPVTVDGHTWNGNGSVISLASGTKTGYGLTQDEAMIHPDSARPPAVFFQWEIDGRDGRRLEIAADGMTTATIRYGAWNDRKNDVSKTVSLPYTIDPVSDGRSGADGEYYVVQVAFDRAPAASTVVSATTR